MDIIKVASKLYNTYLWLSGTWKKQHKYIINNLLLFFDKKDRTILDYGCGGGTIVQKLAGASSISRKFYGVDIYVNPHYKTKNFKLTLFDGKNLPYANDAFDAVYLIDVLHHLPGYSRTQYCLSEIVRVTKNRIIIHDYVYETPKELRILKIADELVNRQYGVQCPMNFYKQEQWDRLLSNLPFNGSFKKIPGDFGRKLGFWWTGIRTGKNRRGGEG